MDQVVHLQALPVDRWPVTRPELMDNHMREVGLGKPEG